MNEILQHFKTLLTFFLKIYSDMIRLLEAIFRLNIKECMYVYIYIYIYIYTHSFMLSLKMASKSRNMSL